MTATITIEPAEDLPVDDLRQFNVGYRWTLKGEGIDEAIVSHAATLDLAKETALFAAEEHGIKTPHVTVKEP